MQDLIRTGIVFNNIKPFEIFGKKSTNILTESQSKYSMIGMIVLNGLEMVYHCSDWVYKCSYCLVNGKFFKIITQIGRWIAIGNSPKNGFLSVTLVYLVINLSHTYHGPLKPFWNPGIILKLYFISFGDIWKDLNPANRIASARTIKVYNVEGFHPDGVYNENDLDRIKKIPIQWGYVGFPVGMGFTS